MYRMTQVSAVMTHDEDYNEFNLRVIRFIEMGDENVSASQYPIIESVGQVTKPTLRSDVMNSIDYFYLYI